MHKLTIALAGLLLLAGCQPAASPPNLSLEDGWIRGMPPGVRMTAAYGEIHNRSAEAITIDGFYSPDYGLVEMHETRLEGGQSSMHPVPKLTLAPGEIRVLEPGGMHLMMMQPASHRQPDRVELEIISGETRYAAELVKR